jgi:ferredoxin
MIMAKVNPYFVKEINKFGADEFKACYNCGNCTATCTLTNKDHSFPRKMIRYSMLGLKSEIKSSIEPWLCYYCGDCASSCPRQANPANIVMALRRYLIASYDWTGLSGLLYKNLIGYIAAFSIIILGIIGLYNSNVWTHTEWIHYGHYFEMIAIGSVFAFILLPNIIRMWYFTVGKKKIKFNPKVYLIALKELFIHMFTQKKSLSCEENKDNNIWWFEHFILVIGYLSLLFVTVFLNWFGTGSNLVIYLGYIFSAIIFMVTFDFVIRRIRKRTEKSSTSHFSDWFFVIWLFLMGISAFTVRLFIDTGILEHHFWFYLFHLTILAQWALIIVPFGKWTHFLYRSFAMYFSYILDNADSKK